MTLPIATTTITVRRPASLADGEDPYDEPTTAPKLVAAGVRAHISVSAAVETVTGRASTNDITYKLNADPIELDARDQITDDRSGEVFEVVWARQQTGLGLDHTSGELRRVAGSV